MGELVNLRMARKRASRQQEEQSASTNRLAHGQPKHVRKLEAAREEQAKSILEQHRIEGDGR